MGFMYNYNRLKFYQRADVLGNKICDLTMSFPRHEIYALRDQMRRACDSVVLNIAEGSSKKTVRDMVSYLRHALGSLDEIQAQIGKCVSRGYVDEKESLEILKELREISKMIHGFIWKLRDEEER